MLFVWLELLCVYFDLYLVLCVTGLVGVLPLEWVALVVHVLACLGFD